VTRPSNLRGVTMDAVALHRAGAPQYANDLDIVGTCKRSAARCVTRRIAAWSSAVQAGGAAVRSGH